MANLTDKWCPATGRHCELNCVGNCALQAKSPMPAPHALTGWQCPACGRGNAPWNATCPCGPHLRTGTGYDTSGAHNG